MVYILETIDIFKILWKLKLYTCAFELIDHLSPGHSLIQFLLSIKTSLLEYLTNYKALMIFHNNVPNSHVPAFLGLLENVLLTTGHSKSENYTSVNVILHLQKFPSIVKSYLVWLLISVVTASEK